jgi:hypothetical protein
VTAPCCRRFYGGVVNRTVKTVLKLSIDISNTLVVKLSTQKPSSNSSPNSDDITSIRKSLDKILKLQQPDEGEELKTNKMMLNYMSMQNEILSRLLDYIENSTTYLGRKKSVPYGTGIVQIPIVQLEPPANDNDYAVIINVYAQNNMKPISQMNLVNEGPGNIFFKAAYAYNVVSSEETELRPNEIRSLFNVYEIRMRTDLYLTGYRLLEEDIHTGSLSSSIKNYIEVRPVLTANEKLKIFSAVFDNQTPTLVIQQPSPTQTLAVDFSMASFQTPLIPGRSATLIDFETGVRMPYTVIYGSILEAFSVMSNLNTDASIRIFVETDPILTPGIYTLVYNFPISSRGVPFQLQLNISQISTAIFDPNGAPPPGRSLVVTITNDDPFNSTVGDFSFTAILRRIT